MANIKEFNKVQSAMIERGLTKEQVTKEVSFAVQLINKSKQLQNATTESKQLAVLNVAQCGLTLNPVMKMAYLVPRWSPNGTMCCLEPSYQGLVKLLTDTGSVETIQCQLVYSNDEFQMNPGEFQNPVTHVVNPFSTNRGEIIGVYAVAILPSGTKQADAMAVKEVNDIRETSESWKAYKAGKIKSCIWVEHYGEMTRKTMLRRIVKYLPKSDKFERVADAISLDESDYQASDAAKQYAYSLLENSTIVERLEIATFESAIDSASPDELSDLILNLQSRQRDNGRYSAKEINDKVQQIASDGS